MFGYRRRNSLSLSFVVLIGFYLFRLVSLDALPLTGTLRSVDKWRERAAIVDSIEVPEAPPEQLAELVNTASQEALKLQQTPVAADNSSTGSEEMARELFTGVKTADKLMAHPDATSEQRSTARRKKLTLLYVGAQSDREMFAPPLYDYVDELIDEEPSSNLAILGTALRIEIRDFTDETSKDEVLPKLIDYATTNPNHPAGIELFRLYGEHLLQQEDPAGARQCYEQAIALYGEIPAVEPLHRGIGKAKLAEAQLAIKRRGERLAAEAKQVQVKRKLENYPDGYFVVYAEENVKPPRGGGIYYYRYEYEVLEGVPSVISYDKDLPKKWSWKLVKRFPDNPQGRDEAYELWKKLLHKKKSSCPS